MARTYKVRKFTSGRNKSGELFMNYSLTVPIHIAERLPEDLTFVCELTEDGILFRPSSDTNTSIELPAWAEKKKSARKRPEQRLAA